MLLLRLRNRAAGLLPEGRLLPEAVWDRRHDAIVRLCLISAGLLVLVAWLRGGGQPAAVAVLAAVAGPVALAVTPRLGRKARAAAATASLMAASVALVHLWSGVTEAHFVFFVMIGVVSLYFGTGFSGLSYLRHLPADIIKIDRSFVMDLPQGRSAVTLIASIVELARTLGLDVVAEGVETEGQRRALADLHCGSAQGYLFARPEPAARAGAFLSTAVVSIPAQPAAPAIERLQRAGTP